MDILLTVLYVIVCFFLIAVVLLQSGKGGGMGAAFGAGSSQTVFGGAGAGNLLTRATSVCAALFMILSATLAYRASQHADVIEQAQERARIEQEARTGAAQTKAGADATKVAPGAMSVEGDAGPDASSDGSSDATAEPQADTADEAAPTR